MRYYRSNRKSSGKTRKILFRILFVAVAAIIIASITLAIGNHLKEKVEKANADTTETHVSTGLQTERHLEESAIYSDYSPTVFGASISVSDYLRDDADSDVRADVKTLSEHFDTLTIDLVDGSGSLIYESAALCAISRIPHDTQSDEEAIIRSALDEAKKDGLRTCAVILPMLMDSTVSGAAAVDSALITELGEMGFDEVLMDLTEYVENELTTDTANKIRTYVHECSSLTKDVCKLGVEFSADVFLNSSNAKQIQLIANAASFLAVKFDLDEVYITTEAYDMVSSAVASLLGNFSVYNMRVIIDSRFDIISAAVYTACKDRGALNVSFSNYILPESLGYSDSPANGNDPETEEPDPPTPEDNTNPYATTSDNPSIGAPEKTDDGNDDLQPDPDTDGDGLLTDSGHSWY